MPEFGFAPFVDPGAMERHHQSKERARIIVPSESKPLRELNEKEQVYIYNAGPWPSLRTLGSYGQLYIQGLDEAKVFDGLAVAGPLVIPGLPSECYPREGMAERQYHTPPETMGEDLRPGYHFALEVIGRGRMVNSSSDLTPEGIFISLQPEQKRPNPDTLKAGKVPEAQLAAWKRWESDVKEAQRRLRETCSKMCQDANVEWGRGKFADVRTDKLYQAARLIKGSELQYGWLKDTGDKAENMALLIKQMALKCPHCGAQQVSDEELRAYQERVAKGVM